MQCSGGKVTRDAGPVKGGTSVIAFVEDPTGYKWEIIGGNGKEIREPIAQVVVPPCAAYLKLWCMLHLHMLEWYWRGLIMGIH